ncbi:hypothetical protein AX16_005329 [Volvariella volvacea WC 439]|nr:hypothetical protein AX16_005329 [Volvariella volvacea WC 439]
MSHTLRHGNTQGSSSLEGLHRGRLRSIQGRSLSVGNAYFVKFGNPKILESEVAVRNCIADHGKAHQEKPGRARIPKLLFSFRRESTAYVVMEYVPLAASPPNPEKVAAMLAWLQGIPLPSGTPVGRLAGGYIRHSFFNDNEAPLAFSSVDAIQRYVNKGYETLSKQAQLTTTPVNLGADRLVLVHPGTGIPVPAGVDTSGDIVLMGDFNVLPESFTKSPGSSRNGNAASMAKIRAALWMISDPELGLDDDGHPKKPNGGVQGI